MIFWGVYFHFLRVFPLGFKGSSWFWGFLGVILLFWGFISIFFRVFPLGFKGFWGSLRVFLVLGQFGVF